MQATIAQQGINVGLLEEEMTRKYPAKRPFNNRSAAAAVLHFSVHRLHLVAFVDSKNTVHLWAVTDAVSSVFDFLVEIQAESHREEGLLRPDVAEFLTSCHALAISQVNGDSGEWLAKRFAMVSEIARGSIVKGDTAATLTSAFWWHFRQFDSGIRSAVGAFACSFLQRNQLGVGRPSKIAQHPEFLACLEESIESLSNVAADARVNSGISFIARGSNASSKHFAMHLKSKYHIFLSRSTVLTYLRPRNIASRAAQRHSLFALPIRPVYDAKAVAKEHANCHYCCSAVKAMMLLAQSTVFRMETFCFSIDAKAHVKTGDKVPVRATVRPVKAWMMKKWAKAYVVADHDFLAMKKFCLILNGFLAISPFAPHSDDEVTRKGQVTYVVRPWEFRSDSAMQQLDDFFLSLDHIVIADPEKLDAFLLGRKFLKVVEITDGGPATKPCSPLVRLSAAFVFRVFSLDLLVRRTNSPETSKLNPVERCHSTVSSSLGGAIPNNGGDEDGMYFAASVTQQKMTNPGMTYNESPINAVAWGDSRTTYLPQVLHDFVGATNAEQRKMYDAKVVVPSKLLEIVRKLGRPVPKEGMHIRDLIELISDGKHGSATSVDSTISRCNEEGCATCGGLWEGKPWVLCDNGSLPMPVPSSVPGHYLPIADLIQSTIADGNQPSWRPSDLIDEVIEGVEFVRGLHDLSVDSPAFIEVRIWSC